MKYHLIAAAAAFVACGAAGAKALNLALQAALNQLDEVFTEAMADQAFLDELAALRRDYAGRPSPLTEAHGE